MLTVCKDDTGVGRGLDGGSGIGGSGGFDGGNGTAGTSGVARFEIYLNSPAQVKPKELPAEIGLPIQ
jgi:purine nucleoside permease